MKISDIKISVVSLFMVISSMPAQADSLYRAESFQALTSDVRSFRVGDALTVIVVESSSAASTADSTVSRQNNMQVTASDTIGAHTAGGGVSRSSDGTGKPTRSGKVQAAISVRVIERHDNGDLVVKGAQKITINGEVQRIAVSGTVRPIDVDANNTVSSTRLVDADIEYTGRGFVARSQEEGWFSRLISLLGF